MVSLQIALIALATTATPDPVLLDFYSDHCGPCRQVAPVVDQLASKGYAVRKVNVDREPQLAAQYGVTGVPCFVMVAGGREVGRLVGAHGLPELENLCRSASRPIPAAPGVNPAPSNAVYAQQGQQPPSTFAAAPASSPLENMQQPPANPFAAPVASAGSAAPPSHAPAAAPSTTATHDDPRIARMIAASVRLRIDDPQGHSVGSGTIIDSRDGEALVLTCGHIFRDSKGQGKITIDTFGPNARQGYEGILMSYDLEKDVAIVRFTPGVDMPAARIAPPEFTPRVGEQVVSVGCDGGADATARIGQVTAVNRFLGPPNIQVSGEPVQGRSGGGLFTMDGRVIGVCNAADPSEGQGLFAAGESIRSELSELQILDICLDPPATPAAQPAALANASPGNQPRTSLVALPGANAAAAAAPAAFNSHESAALDALRSAPEAEVICIVRPLNDPSAKSQVIVLDKASPAFLEQLAAERNVQNGRRLTSLELRRPAPPVREPVTTAIGETAPRYR